MVGTDIAELLLRDHRTAWLPGKSPNEANLIDFTNEAVGQVEEEESGEAQLSFLTDSHAATTSTLEKETERFRELLLYGRKKVRGEGGSRGTEHSRGVRSRSWARRRRRPMWCWYVLSRQWGFSSEGCGVGDLRARFSVIGQIDEFPVLRLHPCRVRVSGPSRARDRNYTVLPGEAGAGGRWGADHNVQSRWRLAGTRQTAGRGPWGPRGRPGGGGLPGRGSGTLTS